MPPTLTLKNSTFFQFCIILCCIGLSEQTAFIILNSVKLLVFVMEYPCVYCEGGHEFMYIISITFILQRANPLAFIDKNSVILSAICCVQILLQPGASILYSMQGLPKYILPEKKRNSDGGRFSGRKLQRLGLEKNSWSRGSGGSEYLQSTNPTSSTANSTSTLKSTPAGSKCKITFLTIVTFGFTVIYFNFKTGL